MTNDCKTCPVSTGTHKPAEAVHQIDEPQAEALLELAAYRFTVENREARIAELEAQLDAIGAGGVEPLRKQAAAPQAVQAAVPVAWRLTNTAFRKPRFEYHDTKESAEQRQADFNRSVDDGGLHNLTPLYAAPAHPAEGVPAQDVEIKVSAVMLKVAALIEKRVEVEPCAEAEAELLKFLRAALAATQPAAQGMEAPLIETCDEGGHKYAKLPDHPMRQGMPRCPHCMAIGLDRARTELAAQAKQGGA